MSSPLNIAAVSTVSSTTQSTAVKQLLSEGYQQCSQSQGFSEHIGPFYEKVETTNEGEINAIRALIIDEHHLNPEGVVHGGVTLSLMDYACYRAIGDEVGHDIKFATINLNSNFLAPAELGNVLYGKGSIVRKTRSVIFADGKISNGERDIMTASGIWKIIGN